MSTDVIHTYYKHVRQLLGAIPVIVAMFPSIFDQGRGGGGTTLLTYQVCNTNIKIRDVIFPVGFANIQNSDGIE